VGREYICPKVGSGGDTVKNMIEQPLHPWFHKQQHRSRCHKCFHRKCKCGMKKQVGGGHKPYPQHKMRYTATGELVEYKCNSCYTYTPNNGLGDQNGGGSGSHSANVGSDETMGWPRSTCKKHKACKDSSNCGYVKFDSKRQYGNIQREVPGVYLDVSANPIARRSKIDEHDNHLKIPKSLLNNKQHNLNRKLGCYQPFWDKQCM